MEPPTLEEQLAASIEWAKQRKRQREGLLIMPGTLKLQTNVWAEIALKFADGKEVEGNYGRQMMYTTTTDEKLYLPLPAAEKVKALGVAKGEVFAIRKAEQPGTTNIHWEVKRYEAATVPPAAAPARPVNGHANNANGNGSAPAAHPQVVVESEFSRALQANTYMLIDTIAICKNYSSKYNGLMSADDVRSAVFTAYIAMTKGGAR
jgi:hypothetical protein